MDDDRNSAAPAPAEETSPWDKIDLAGTMAEATRRVVAEVERRKIERALKDAGGNKGRVADMLQISFKVLTAKLREYGID